ISAVAGRVAPFRRASARQIARSLRIQSTAKPKSNLPWFIVLPRFSICQEPAAPFAMTSRTASMSRPARLPKWMPSASPWTRPAMQIWLTILVSGPEHDLPEVVVVADAREHDLLALGGGPRRRRGAAAVLGRPPFGLGGRAVVDRHVVALGLEVAGHRVAHAAQTQECDLRHRVKHSRSVRGF